MRSARAWTARLAVAFVSVLIAGACAQDDVEPQAEPSPSPTRVLSIEGDFNLTGDVTAVDVDTVPDEIESWDDVDLPEFDDPGDPGDRPEDPTRLSVDLQSFSDELRDTCDVEVGDTVDVWLTLDTDVVPGIDGDIDAALDDQFVSAQGSIAVFEADGDVDATAIPDEDTDATATPNGDVDATANLDDDADGTLTIEDCVLIAEQVEIAEGEPTDGTTTRRSTPTPDGSPDSDDAEETEEPERTSTPRPTPTRTPGS